MKIFLFLFLAVSSYTVLSQSKISDDLIKIYDWKLDKKISKRLKGIYLQGKVVEFNENRLIDTTIVFLKSGIRYIISLHSRDQIDNVTLNIYKVDELDENKGIKYADLENNNSKSNNLFSFHCDESGSYIIELSTIKQFKTKKIGLVFYFCSKSQGGP